MGKSAPSPPPPPDPNVVAAAQTGSNVMTSQANTILANANEKSPMGSVNYNIVGYQAITDPSNGQVYQIPKYERVQTLSPEQQALYNQQTQIATGLNKLALDQTQRIQGVLGTPFNAQGLPDAPNTISPQSAATGFADVGGIARNVSQQNAATGFADVGGPQRFVGPNDYSADRQRVEQALMSRINPQIDRDRNRLENQLVNQGLVRGSQAFNTAADEIGRQANDARMQAILAGGQEQSRMQGLDFARFGIENQAQQQAFEQAGTRGEFFNQATLQNNQARLLAAEYARAAQQQAFEQAQNRAGFFNAAIGQNNQAQQAAAQFAQTARERALQEQLAIRNQPINEIGALMSGGQVTMPQFSPFRGAQMSETPVGQYHYQSADIAQRNWMAEMQANAANNGAIFGALGRIGAGMFSLSDRRLKRDITPVGTGAHGLTAYTFRYLWDNTLHLGYMADEVRAVRPDAVTEIAGYLAVDYGALANG